MNTCRHGEGWERRGGERSEEEEEEEEGEQRDGYVEVERVAGKANVSRESYGNLEQTRERVIERLYRSV